MNPFIVTTTRPMPIDGTPGDGSTRLAVATLEEAQRIVGNALQDAGNLYYGPLRESGGTVGLPDGSLIQVEPHGWEFFDWHHIEPPMPDQRAEILAAFNAKQAGQEVSKRT